MEFISNFGHHTKTFYKSVWKGERVSIQAVGKPTITSIQNDSCDQISVHTEGLYATTAKEHKVYDVIAPYKTTALYIWLTINVPANISSGFYRSDCGHLVLKVLPLILTKVTDWHFHLDLWQNPWAVARYHRCEPWSDVHITLLRNHLAVLADAGQKVITVTVVENVWVSQTFDEHHTMVSWSSDHDDPTYNLQFDFTIMDQYINVCRSAGIHGPIHCFSILPWGTNLGCGNLDGKAKYVIYHKGNRITVEASPGDAVYKSIWSQFLAALVKKAREKDWVDQLHFAFDERHEDEIQSALQLLRDYLPSDFQPPKTASAYEYNERYAQEITNLSPSFNTTVDWNDIAAHRRSQGKLTTFYLCEWSKPPAANTFLTSPPHESIWVGWYAAANGLDGFLRWAYDSWPEEPFLSGDYSGPHGNWPAGDTFLVYPHGWRSRRLALLREGIQDYEKLRIIKDHVGQKILEPFVFAKTIPGELLQEAQEQLAMFSELFSDCAATQTVYIIRHCDRFDSSGDTWKQRSRKYDLDYRDTPLSDIGVQQATQMGKYFKKLPIDHIYTSPYLRTLQTADRIAEQLDKPIKIENGLSEGYHHGVAPIKDRLPYFPRIDDEYQSEVNPRAGEKYPDQFFDRVTAMSNYAHRISGDHILFISHAAPSLALAANLLGVEYQQVGTIAPGEVIRLERCGEKYSFVNKFTPHKFKGHTAAWGF
jgi:broad specificity phosphatase PhoE